MTDGFGFDDRTADAAVGDTPTERVVARLKKLNADPVRFDFGDEDVVRFVDRQWERVFGDGDAPRTTTFETFRPRVTRDDAVLDGPVGAGALNHPLDGFRAKKLLNRAAGFPFRPGEEDFGEVGPRVVSAIKRFQADRGLAPDGVIQPGGPTVEVLGREALGAGEGRRTPISAGEVSPNERDRTSTLLSRPSAGQTILTAGTKIAQKGRAKLSPGSEAAVRGEIEKSRQRLVKAASGAGSEAAVRGEIEQDTQASAGGDANLDVPPPSRGFKSEVATRPRPGVTVERITFAEFLKRAAERKEIPRRTDAEANEIIEVDGIPIRKGVLDLAIASLRSSTREGMSFLWGIIGRISKDELTPQNKVALRRLQGWGKLLGSDKILEQSNWLKQQLRALNTFSTAPPGSFTGLEVPFFPAPRGRSPRLSRVRQRDGKKHPSRLGRTRRSITGALRLIRKRVDANRAAARLFKRVRESGQLGARIEASLHGEAIRYTGLAKRARARGRINAAERFDAIAEKLRGMSNNAKGKAFENEGIVKLERGGIPVATGKSSKSDDLSLTVRDLKTGKVTHVGVDGLIVGTVHRISGFLLRTAKHSAAKRTTVELKVDKGDTSPAQKLLERAAKNPNRYEVYKAKIDKDTPTEKWAQHQKSKIQVTRFLKSNLALESVSESNLIKAYRHVFLTTGVTRKSKQTALTRTQSERLIELIRRLRREIVARDRAAGRSTSIGQFSILVSATLYTYVASGGLDE